MWCCAVQGYQLGKTKVFLRAGQMAQLDKLRTVLMHNSAVTIQRHVRGLLARHQYQRQLRAAIRLQVRPHSLPSRNNRLAPLADAMLSCVMWLT